MINQIIWYWLAFVFSIIAGGLTYLVNQYHKMWKELKDNALEKQLETLKVEMQEYTQNALKETEESHNKLYSAVFDMYSRQFIAECDYYLSIPRGITNAEYTNLYRNFEIYKSLGGNGLGEKKFDKIESKTSDKQMIQEIANTFQINKNSGNG